MELQIEWMRGVRVKGRILSNMEGDTPTHVVTWVSFMRRVNLEAIFYPEPELHLAGPSVKEQPHDSAYVRSAGGGRDRD